MTAIEVRPEDYAPLKRAADAGRVRCIDLGDGLRPRQLLDQPAAGACCARIPRAAWMQRDELRQAISLAVDRQVFADTDVPGRRRAGLRPGDAAPTRSGIQPTCRTTPHDPRAKALLARQSA